MNNYYISVRAICLEKNKNSGHVIKAESLKQALLIFDKYQTTFIQDRKLITRYGYILDIEEPFHKNLIERRKIGIGGNIWYEEDEKLKTVKS